MKIYVVTFNVAYEGGDVEAAFSTEELAVSFLKEKGFELNTDGEWCPHYTSNFWYDYEAATIIPLTLDNP